MGTEDKKKMKLERDIYETISDAYNHIVNEKDLIGGINLYNRTTREVNENKDTLGTNFSNARAHLRNLESAIDRLYESNKEAIQ